MRNIPILQLVVVTVLALVAIYIVCRFVQKKNDETKLWLYDLATTEQIATDDGTSGIDSTRA